MISEQLEPEKESALEQHLVEAYHFRQVLCTEINLYFVIFYDRLLDIYQGLLSGVYRTTIGIYGPMIIKVYNGLIVINNEVV